MSTLSTNQTAITPEQMEQLSGDRLTELVDGQLVEKHVSSKAQLVARNLLAELVVWERSTGAGKAFCETTFQCFPHAPQMVRRPDVAFVAASGLAAQPWEKAHLVVAPDLAAEVVSPNDDFYGIDRKINDYFKAGVKRVWVINPDQRSVRIYSAPDAVRMLMGDSEVTDDDVLPGFRCPLSTLFAEPS